MDAELRFGKRERQLSPALVAVQFDLFDDADKQSVLTWLIDTKRFDLLEHCIKQRPDIARKTPNLLNCLAKNLRPQNFKFAFELIKFLIIELDCDASQLNEDGNTFLHQLFTHRNLPDYYADLVTLDKVDVSKRYGTSPVEAALYGGRLNFAVKLIKNFAPVDSINLHRMYLKPGFSAVVKLMVHAGLDLKRVDLSAEVLVPSKQRKEKKVLLHKHSKIVKQVEQEIHRLKTFVVKWNRSVRPLWMIAARKVRTVHGRQISSILRTVALGQAIEDYLRLENVVSNCKYDVK